MHGSLAPLSNMKNNPNNNIYTQTQRRRFFVQEKKCVKVIFWGKLSSFGMRFKLLFRYTNIGYPAGGEYLQSLLSLREILKAIHFHLFYTPWKFRDAKQIFIGHFCMTYCFKATCIHCLSLLTTLISWTNNRNK